SVSTDLKHDRVLVGKVHTVELLCHMLFGFVDYGQVLRQDDTVQSAPSALHQLPLCFVETYHAPLRIAQMTCAACSTWARLTSRCVTRRILYWSTARASTSCSRMARCRAGASRGASAGSSCR